MIWSLECDRKVIYDYKSKEEGKYQESIKYHAWPETPHWKDTKHKKTSHIKELQGKDKTV